MGARGEAMGADVNRAVVRRFVEEGLGRGDFAALAALAAPDCVDHAASAHGGAGRRPSPAWRSSGTPPSPTCA